MSEDLQDPSTAPAEEFPHRYTAALAGSIEAAWQRRWEEEQTFAAPRVPPEGSPCTYVIDMFPYPSGDTLHVGHPVGYLATDAYARFARMTGHTVLHPFGFDAFGLPAEQYAIAHGLHPRESTERNIATMAAQLRRLGMAHTPGRTVSTMEPEFYRWTQWGFLQMYGSWYDREAGRARPVADLVAEYERGQRATPDGRPWAEYPAAQRRDIVDGQRLAYLSNAEVNWCPGLGTVLANEEVTADGRSERGNFPVFRRPLRQWVLRITAYADRLIEDLQPLDWPEPIKAMQRNWIGRSEGAYVDFPYADGNGTLPVFTTRPETLPGVTFVAVAAGGDDEGPTGRSVRHPLSGDVLPVYRAAYVLEEYGTGAVMGVPALDERDRDFATRYGLPVREVPADTGDVVAALEAMGAGARAVTYRLRDWLFSRQRYWGEPFPIVYDDEGQAHPVPESCLPVELPELADFAPRAYDPEDADTDPESPLSRARDWVEVKLDLGDGLRTYRRETNTMPQWAGSCWYELRYLDPRNDERLVDTAVERAWMGPRHDGDSGGVDLYVGGVEHAVLHLLYARFWHKVLHDLGHLSSSEPFRRLVNQGYVQAPAYTDARGAYVPAAEVEQREGTYWHAGEPVQRSLGKMGKSLKNSVRPDELCEQYGADSLRLYTMAMGPLETSRPWDPQGIAGSYRFLQRLWRNVIDERTGACCVSEQPASERLRRLLHRTIDGVRADMAGLRMHLAVAKLMTLNTELARVAGAKPREVVEPLLLMVAPLAPHIAEELWQRVRPSADRLASCAYPVADPALVADDTVTCVVQVAGKVRDRLQVSATAGEDELRERALSSTAVLTALAGRSVRNVVVRAPRLVNVVPE